MSITVEQMKFSALINAKTWEVTIKESETNTVFKWRFEESEDYVGFSIGDFKFDIDFTEEKGAFMVKIFDVTYKLGSRKETDVNLLPISNIDFC